MPGDDIRLIDWNVSARMNEPYVKLFIEEREMTVLLLVDMSPRGASARASRRSASWPPSWRPSWPSPPSATTTGWAHHLHRRGGALRAAQEGQEARPAGDQRDPLLRAALAAHPHRRGLEFLGRIARRRAVAFLVSDFLAPQASYERALRITARRHDLVPVTVSDPLEEALPPVGLLELEDPETGEVVVFDSSGPEARVFAAESRRTREAREALWRRLSLDAITLRTDRSYLPALTSFFEARARRLRH
jgi:uncharacterized protein (DUF58 family)